MAAIGKIRSWGPVLVVIIGLALFAFIAEELVRSCNSGNQAEARRVGSVLGKNIDIDDFNKLIEEYKNVKKANNQDENLQDGDYDYLWSTYVQNALIQHEADQLGLTVTDEELQNVLKEGTNPLLVRSGIFVNQQTGRFDANELKKFMDEYDKIKNGASNAQTAQQAEYYGIIYAYWMFTERTLREQLLSQKYQALLAGCYMSNPIEAKMAFDGQNIESNIQLASIAYSTVKDGEVKISDDDMEKKYDEMKEAFRIFEQQRNFKFAMYQVTASEADRKATTAEVTKYAAKLDSVADPSELVHQASSDVHFLNVPMLKTSYPYDIAQRLDSIPVGKTVGPFLNPQDNSIAVIRLLSKESLPDSIQYRMIMAPGKDETASKATADSIFAALKAGANFKVIAQKYGQPGDSIWSTGDDYLRDQQTGQIASSINDDQKALIDAVNHCAAGEIREIKLTNGNVIVEVTARKKMTEKYNAAVIKREFTFSKDTRTAAYNKFATFAAQSKDGLQAMEAAAKKNGYKIEEDRHVSTVNHGIPMQTAYDQNGRPMTIPSSREALKWVFQAKEGDVSGLLECGTNRDIYLLICLTKIDDKGYLPLDDKDVKEMVKSEVLRDKKAEMIMAKLNGVKDINAAKAKGAVISDVAQVTFASPATVSPDGKTPAQEPAVSGAVAATKAGAFVSHPVKGNQGVYLFKVLSKTPTQAKFNASAVESQLRNMYMQMSMNSVMQLLWNNAGIKDNRYLFF